MARVTFFSFSSYFFFGKNMSKENEGQKRGRIIIDTLYAEWKTRVNILCVGTSFESERKLNYMSANFFQLKGSPLISFNKFLFNLE